MDLEIFDIKLTLVRAFWPSTQANPTVPQLTSINGLRMFYRGKELKNKMKLKDCGF